jgi:hypothetical protein
VENLHPRSCVLLIGTNNHRHTAGEIAQGIATLVDKLRSYWPGTKIILLVGSRLPLQERTQKFFYYFILFYNNIEGDGNNYLAAFPSPSPPPARRCLPGARGQTRCGPRRCRSMR